MTGSCEGSRGESCSGGRREPLSSLPLPSLFCHNVPPETQRSLTPALPPTATPHPHRRQQLNTESLGADLIRLLHANGTCALLPTTAAAKFPGFELPEGESLFKLTSVNVTTRLTFACNFTNTSTVPSAISVDAGLSTATGAFSGCWGAAGRWPLPP